MQSDEALARGIQQGNTNAMKTLANRYYAPLLRYLYRMCGHQQTLAEDLVQETFLRMMRGIQTYDSQRPFKAWVYTIASNVVRNHFASADARYTENAPVDHDYRDQRQSPEDHIMMAEDTAQVINALMQLPDLYRAVVVLFYYENLPQKEIAAILNIPVGTVKSRLSNGLKRLRTLIQDRVKDTPYD